MEHGSSHWVDIILDQDLTSENKLRRLLNDMEFRNMMVDINWFTGLDDGKKINEFKEALNKFHAKTCVNRNALAKWSQILDEIRELNQRALKQFESNERFLDTFKKKSMQVGE
jgi:hypothetical protein